MKRLFTLAFILCMLHPAMAGKQPNILLILADDLGYSDLGCYGGEVSTPHVDALAKNGARFTQLYNSARCCPSRASLMTGLYPSQAGIGDFTTSKPSPKRGPGYLGRLSDQCVTLAEVLKPAGYGCYYVGKWHMHEHTGPIKRGFDEFYGYTRGHSHDQYDAEYYIRLPGGRKKEIDPTEKRFYATDVFNAYALEFIRQGQKSGKPWFLFLGHSSPHFPVQAPAKRADKYDATYFRGWDVLRAERFERMRKIGLIDGQHWKFTPRSLVPVDREDIANGFPGQPNPAWDTLDPQRQRDLARRMAVFAAMVESVDHGVGQIVDHLKSTGDFEDTLILFLSDNGACYEWGPYGFDGPSRRGTTTLHAGGDLRKIGGPGTHQSYGSAWANLGNTPFRLYKHFTHEGGISTPFIVHWPGGIGTPDKWIREPSHVMDIMPTIIEAAGAKYPARFNDHAIPLMEGTSLLPATRGEKLAGRLIGFDHQGARALRKGDWKIVWSKRMPYEIEWELYNLAEDRCETTDLAERYPDRVKTMAAEWEQWACRVQVIYEQGASKPSNKDGVRVDSPLIENRQLEISAEVSSADKNGVMVAHGGREQGYAVHLHRGRPAFDVRIHGTVTRIIGKKTAPGSFRVRAVLDPATMRLFVNDDLVAQGPSPGLIPVQPKDEMNIGRDELSAAGNYEAPNPLDGIIRDLQVIATPSSSSKGKSAASTHITRPIFADPNYHGSCDPEVVWNTHENAWWIFYTARRATRDNASYVGTPIGVISSPDLSQWTFRGYCTFGGVKGRPDMPDTHWAPAVIRDGDTYHMFATYKDNAVPPWGGSGVIRHYTAPADDLLQGWKRAGIPAFQQPDPIDATLIKVGDRFRAYYRVGKGGGIQWASSKDLQTWDHHGKCPGDVNGNDRGYQEAPYVSRFGGFYWMLTDPHKGLAVYRSDDGIDWTLQEHILEEPGVGLQDGTRARHPSVAVVGDRAFILYHVEPNRPYPSPPAEKRTPRQKISFLQIAELKIQNGKLTCNRNATVVPLKP